MNNKLLEIAPLALIFALAGCAAHRPVKADLHQAATQAAVQLSGGNGFEMVAGCSGDNGRSGVLSYNESTDEYRLQLVTGNKVEVIQHKQDPADNNAPMVRLNDFCYPKWPVFL